MNRRTFLRSATIALAGVTAPRLANATPRLRVTRHKIPWLELPRPLRIAHLTDVHVGWTTPKDVLECAIEVVRRAQPQLVALTGDYVNHSLKHVDRLSWLVSELPKPVFATLGNHDHWSGADGVREALRRGGATVLTNESVLFDHRGVTLPIVGVDDGRTGNADIARAFSKLAKKDRPLVLTHYPNTADEIIEHGGRLVLAGHTHGGQVHVPHVTPLVSKMIGQPYLAGWYDLEEGQLYVSAGIGASLEGLRGGRAAVPEVALFDLVPAEHLTHRISKQLGFNGRRFQRLNTANEKYEHVLRAISDDL